MGCDSFSDTSSRSKNLFQSTHPSGVRPVSSIRVQRPHHISIHAPQWGATGNSSTYAAPPRFQSTHPSGVRRGNLQNKRCFLIISIHAPQWGATRFSGWNARGQRISIHAPQWGATVGRPFQGRTYPKFQSTHPSGVRRIFGGFRQLARPISIHAPQWGATYDSNGVARKSLFQSTHPSGVRRPRGPQ